MEPTMSLGVFLLPGGHHPSAWRVPDGPVPDPCDIDYVASLASLAEHGGFHFLFLADSDALWRSDGAALRRDPNAFGLEPLTLLSALSRSTETLGLVATVSTSYHDPYSVARRLSSLDHLSRGRAGWNIVTSFMPQVAANFGGSALPAHDRRYERAEEFMNVVDGLWRLWGHGIVTRDRASGNYLAHGEIPTLDHSGPHFAVRGPLNQPPSPQSRPLLVQAGSSPAGMSFAARWSEVVFTVESDLDSSARTRARFHELLAGAGRVPGEVRLMPGLLVLVEDTDEQAWRVLDRLQSMVDPHLGLVQLKDYGFPIDMTEHSWSDPVPAVRGDADGQQGRQEVLRRIAAAREMSIEQLARYVAFTRGHNLLVGSAERVADEMERWWRAGACDGFNVMPARLPLDLERFSASVVPLLRDRGVLTAPRPGWTLREQLGLTLSPVDR
ncbi:NtaA/DmoA family FMN-dependent monooxygenase [Amycolatopsis alkalitolerans]|uniref:NtaA/DmoA family FMN-dependent monooxygenase n=1 Tax=Amycolatopsis alkalitolerans TaxID=2547244 RepID=A0A5C4M0T5_9PSEU|nr:NtaA/DmoA family FMN-dependent monooxygenase [Amycolatopsis alkalitolerans]TNC25185.1 NtaA/DmoA family FMN-dependent monooxygenase [Amycolatopsis alkalitolerans]